LSEPTEAPARPRWHWALATTQHTQARMREQQPAADRSEGSPLQFSIRTLLLATAAVAILVVVCQRVGPVWGASIIWFLVLVAAHVAANAHGTRQTGRASLDLDRLDLDRAGGAEAIDDASSQAREARRRHDAIAHAAPITRLGICHGPAGRVLLCVITVGAALGAIIGTLGLVFLTTAETSGILLGVVSTAVLGGFLGFACGSFVLVMSRAFHEAVQDPNIVATCRRGEMA
jgi:hypothetical protein